MDTLLSLQDITCRFPGGVVANDHVTLDIYPGEVHALLGENGAGKSTLMKVAFGMQPPTEGTILWKGQPVVFRSAADAMAAGIGMVHQHFMLIPSFRVWENIALGHEPTQAYQLAPQEAIAKVRKLSEEYGLHVDPEALVSHLSVGEQQRVEILKCLYRDSSLLILDEPTAVLTPQETDELFATLKQLVDAGRTIIFISHKLREVKAIAHRMTILRKGKQVASGLTADYTIEELATAMVGRPLAPPTKQEHDIEPQPALLIYNISAQDDRGLPAIQDVALTLHKGEILGIAGVEGNGQSELLDVLAGLRPVTQGNIALNEQDITHHNARQRFEAGLAHVPADRQHQGLVMEMSVQENLLLGRHHETAFQKRGLWIDHDALASGVQQQIKQYDIAPPNPQLAVRSLSGGNQQKVVIARECSRPASVFLVAHPTRGVDIGAIEAIHTELLNQRQDGAAILLFSSELPELLALCDRIAVIYEGQIVTTVDASQTNETELGIWMTGSHT